MCEVNKAGYLNFVLELVDESNELPACILDVHFN